MYVVQERHAHKKIQRPQTDGKLQQQPAASKLRKPSLFAWQRSHDACKCLSAKGGKEAATATSNRKQQHAAANSSRQQAATELAPKVQVLGSGC